MGPHDARVVILSVAAARERSVRAESRVRVKGERATKMLADPSRRTGITSVVGAEGGVE